MIKIYPGDDFTLKFPNYIAGKTLPEGSSVSLKLFTINQSESYTLTVTENPFPTTLKLASDVLSYMVSGVLQTMYTTNIPDPSMTDSYFNDSKIFTTDYFWINQNSSESMSELNKKIDDLDSSVRQNYATNVYVSTLEGEITTLDRNLRDNYYSTSVIDNNYYIKSDVDTLIDDLDSSVKNNYYNKRTVDSKFVELDTSVKSNFYNKQNVDLKLSELDSSVKSNYYNKIGVDFKFSLLDTSIRNHYYNKSEIDASIGSIQTILDSIIND